MDKLLTIVVPAYNMHDYLHRCLDSVCVESVMDDVQIIVVNDGSTDDTSEIAHSYQRHYPNYIHVIDKENGNYGSCMNVALPLAVGKYFRTLDADDMLNSSVFPSFVDDLRSTQADIIISNRVNRRFYDENFREESAFDSNIQLNEDIPIMDSLLLDKSVVEQFHVMNIVYKTALLQNIGFRWTEGVFYSDHEYIIMPLRYVKHVRYVSFPLYQYFVGREGQSTSRTQSNKNFMSRYLVTNRILDDLLNDKPQCQFVYVMYLYVLMRLLPNLYNVLYLDRKNNLHYVDLLEAKVHKDTSLVALTDEIDDYQIYRGGRYVAAYRYNKLLFYHFLLIYHLRKSVIYMKVRNALLG